MRAEKDDEKDRKKDKEKRMSEMQVNSILLKLEIFLLKVNIKRKETQRK